MLAEKSTVFVLNVHVFVSTWNDTTFFYTDMRIWKNKSGVMKNWACELSFHYTTT